MIYNINKILPIFFILNRYLYENNLSGSIPPELVNLSELKEL